MHQVIPTRADEDSGSGMPVKAGIEARAREIPRVGRIPAFAGMTNVGHP